MEDTSKDPSVPVLANDPEAEAKNKLTNNGESKKKKEKPPPQFGKRFSKMAKLGSGTFGEVWKGYDAELQRDVAIKRFVQVQTSHLGIDMMIIREISFLRQLDHPNIARVLDVLVGKKLDCGSLLLLMVRIRLFLHLQNYLFCRINCICGGIHFITFRSFIFVAYF